MALLPTDSFLSTSPDTSKSVVIDGDTLDIGRLVSVARRYRPCFLDKSARKAVSQCAANLEQLAYQNTPIYGVNTGFGLLASKKIDQEQLFNLSRNLVLSHSVGVGEPLQEDIVRAGLLVRANTLAKGFSGVRPVLIDTLLSLLNKRVTPIIPSRGSLGSSGDLAPLAHLALHISAHPDSQGNEFSGKVWFNGKLLSGSEALGAAGIAPVLLGPKEGLALINGATFSSAMLALSIADAYIIFDAAEKSAVLSFEALQGISSALDDRIHRARQHPGQIHVARNLKQHLSGSTLVDSSDRVQDAYSLRCIPQVIGPVYEILSFVHQMTLREINAATDNPLIFQMEAVSGGNFHGQPVGLGADYLKTAFCEVGSIAERRIFRLLSYEEQTGLPAMLIPDRSKSGLQSGLMLLQYTAASLVLENQTLATPDSIRSLPTSGGQEDHNSNAMNAARNLMAILNNLTSVIAIEMITACAALDIRRIQDTSQKPGKYAQRLYEMVRSKVPVFESDAPWSDHIADVANLIQSGSFREIRSP
ncbi:MAG: histidine ammonia-lyase [Anaerolineales bacterium]|nr:histidine ammonia-lyase [Anaerolineales bacterium]